MDALDKLQTVVEDLRADCRAITGMDVEVDTTEIDAFYASNPTFEERMAFLQEQTDRVLAAVARLSQSDSEVAQADSQDELAQAECLKEQLANLRTQLMKMVDKRAKADRKRVLRLRNHYRINYKNGHSDESFLLWLQMTMEAPPSRGARLRNHYRINYTNGNSDESFLLWVEGILEEEEMEVAA